MPFLKHGGRPLPKYRFARLVGVDASGELIEARDDSNGSVLTVRIAPAAGKPGSTLRGRLRRIAKPLIGVRHPNLVSVTAVDPERGFLAYEPIQGPALRQLLARTGPLELDAALAVLYDSLAGLEALHAVGVTHGNVGPDAVVIEPAGIALVRDAGLAPSETPLAPPADAKSVSAAGESAASDVPLAANLFLQTLAATAPARQSPAGGLAAQPARVQQLVRRGLNCGVADGPSDAVAMGREVDEAATALYGSSWLKLGRGTLARAAALAAAAGPPPAARTGGDGPRIADAIGWLEHRGLPARRPPWAIGTAAVAVAVAALLVVGVTRGPGAVAPSANRHPLSFGALPFIGSLVTTPPNADGGSVPGTAPGASGVRPVAPAYIPPGGAAPASAAPHTSGAGGASGGPPPAAPTLSLARSTVSAASSTATAGSLAAITVNLVSDGGTPLAGKSVTLQASTGDTSAPVTSGSSGQVNFMVTNFAAGTVTYTAVDNTDGGVALTQHPTITYVAGQWAASMSSISPNGSGPVAEQAGAQVTVTVQLADQYGNPVAGLTVGLSANGSPLAGTVTTDANGLASFTVSDSNAENVTYTVTNSSGATLTDAGGGTLTTTIAWQPPPTPSPTPTPTPSPTP